MERYLTFLFLFPVGFFSLILKPTDFHRYWATSIGQHCVRMFDYFRPLVSVSETLSPTIWA